MVETILDKITSKQFVHLAKNGIIGLVMMMFMAIIIIPIVAEFPVVERTLIRFIALGPWLVALGIAILIPAIVRHLIAVKHGAPLFRATSGSKRYQPWPAHSDPAARRTGWGGLDVKNDVRGRLTQPILKGEVTLRFVIPWWRQVIVYGLLLAGLLLLLAYPLSHAVVYEVVPANVEAFRHLTYMTWPLSVFWGMIIFLLGGWLFASAIRVAKFDQATEQVLFYSQRFFGLFNKIRKPQMDRFELSEAVGLQIISYRAKSTRKNNRLLDQYELNLVFNDGTRQLICKHSKHRTILPDAIQLARFLKLPIWDRSGYYWPNDPDILTPVDPLIRPL